MNMNTDTPETDDATLRAIDIEGFGEFDAVHVQVAKRLERERNSLEDQRDFAQNLIRILERERDAERDLANRLAAALDSTRWDSPIACKAALDRWKEARK